MSHTTTGEWKSFEVRMRRRRAERLIVRAEAAADAGYPEDARACLAEARRLAPGIGGIAAVEQKLAAPEPAGVARSRVWSGAAAMVIVLTLGGWLLRPRADVPTTVVRALPLGAPAAPVSAAPAPAAPASAAPASAAPASAAPASAAPAPVPRAVSVAPPPPSGAVAGRDTAVQSTSTRTEAAVAAAAAAARAERDRRSLLELEDRHVDAGIAAGPVPGVAAVMRPPVSRAPDAVPPDTITRVPVVGDVAAVAAAVDALPLPAPPATVPSPRADAGVRAALDRYAAAYSALDADAAERVWPRVNRAALIRAFDSLASQQISLGACRIDVSAGAARASCAGTATWSPKIGSGGARTEARRWTFELARAGSVWQIINARVQNR